MYKSILIATDGSELSDKGVEHGLALAKMLGAAVTLVTVTANDLLSPYDMAEEMRRGNNPLELYREAMNEKAGEILEAARARAEAAGIEARTVHVPETPPAEGIIEVATRHDCDLIVMSSHGRRGIRRLMLGSQTAEVVATTRIPVLVVR